MPELTSNMNQIEFNEAQAELASGLDEQGITMYGKRIHNPEGKRKSYDIHPYPKQGTGISCTIAYTDEGSGQIIVLFAKKKNKNEHDQIGGYTRGVGPEGSEYLFIEEDEERRDEFEEAILKDQSLLRGTLNTETHKKHYKVTCTFDRNQIQDLMKQDFRNQQQSELGKKINSIETKKYLAANNVQQSFLKLDINDHTTTIREAKEETALDIESLLINKEAKLTQLFTSDDFGISNEDPRLHTKATHYLLYFGMRKEAPAVTPGSDISELTWEPITKIQFKNVNEDVMLNDSKIRMSYVLQVLPRAIKKITELRIEAETNKVFSKPKNINSFFKQLGHEDVGSLPTNIYSSEADQYRQNLIKKSQESTKLIQEVKEFHDILNELKQLDPEKDTKELLAEFKEYLEFKQQNSEQKTLKIV